MALSLRLNRIMGHMTPTAPTADTAASSSNGVAGSSTVPTLETVLVELRGRVGIVTLNRPKQLNVLNDQLVNRFSTYTTHC
jgi:hypothetical protein